METTSFLPAVKGFVPVFLFWERNGKKEGKGEKRKESKILRGKRRETGKGKEKLWGKLSVLDVFDNILDDPLFMGVGFHQLLHLL